MSSNEKSDANRDAQRKGKPIFDPFEDLVEVGAPKERREYPIFRACGHCNGNGRRKDDNNPVAITGAPSCSQCILGRHEVNRVNGKMMWGRITMLFAFEVTPEEVLQLSEERRLGCYFEQEKHITDNHKARILSEEAAGERKTVVVSVVRTWA